ncbi:cytochrome P450 6a8-like [Melanaphis sacchari]|uniref:Cytochrome P450 6a8 n=1 Tax=Melanaphis sacchari TaxID=742174 RepID=A0A2H8TTX3_9HEMI|nr:cytochrome P450 6a8-like [Melanaphis sacchari]
MGAYVTWTLEVLAFATFVVLAVLMPYARRKRDYWTNRGVPVAAGYRSLTNMLPGFRLHDRSLSRHRDDAKAAGATALGLFDGGRPTALACDLRVAAAALGNDGFTEAETTGGRETSLVPSAVDACAAIAVLPTMTVCVAELVTSLEAVANRRLTISPWTEVKNCATTVVATCVYGQPMVDSRIKTFAEQCDKALSDGGRGRPTITDYFASYDLSSDGRASSTDFKQIFRAAARCSDQIDADVADKQVRLDMFKFVTGTIEQTAALVTGVLYELANNQSIQNHLREHLDSELDEHQQQVTIDQLDRLPYLENVLKETLRKYPLVTVVCRMTTKSYVVPGTSGNGTIEPNTLIVVPVHALHHDAEHFSEPENFQPHRFPGQMSSAYMPYGSGSQSYIGKHFVELEAKLIVAMLVSRYEVHLDKDNPCTSPDSLDPRSFAGVRVTVVNRSGVREARMYTSLRQLHNDVVKNASDRKFLFF